MKVNIPVKAMALDMLDKILPQLSPEQIADLRAGRPLTSVIPEAPVRKSPYMIPPVPPTTAFLAAVPEIGNQVQLREHEIAMAVLRQPSPVDVTAILVFSDSRRMRRVFKSVNEFVAQVYASKQMVIANASDTEVSLDPWPDNVRQVRFEPGTTVGSMRTQVIREHVQTQLVYPYWDDDDYHDPLFLSAALNNYKTDAIVTLSGQLRVDIIDARVQAVIDPDGLADTMIAPTRIMKHGYSDTNDAQHDVRVWKLLSSFMVKTIVNTATWPLNTLKVRVWDGNNLLDRDSFIDKGVQTGHWVIGPREQVYLQQLLEKSGIKAIANPAS